MKKRALSLLLASVTAAACLACGCGERSNNSIIILDDGAKTANEASLTVFGHRTDRQTLSVIEDALQSFMTANPDINVTYECATGYDYRQALDRRTTSDNLDNVFMTDRDRLLSLVKEGKIADVSDAVNVDSFNDFARSQLYTDGVIYAVPTEISTYGLYVNYDLLQKNGKEVPKNLSEFTAVCEYFANSGVAPVVCNNYSSLRSLILARGMYAAYSHPDAESEIEKFNKDPESLSNALGEGIDFVCGLIESGYIDKDECAATAEGDELKLFATGERPFMITGGKYSAALRETLNGKALSYGIYAFPVLESGSVLVAQVDSLLSVKKGDNENESKKLVSVLSSPETLIKLNDGQSCFSPLRGQTQIYSDAAIIPSASYLTNGKYVIGSDNNLNYPLDGYLTECGKMILNGDNTVKDHLLNLLKGASR